MKKLYSLIKACMTSDMSLFKIKTKSSRSAMIIPLFIAVYLMFMIWGSANTLFEKVAPFNLQSVILSFFVFSISAMTFIEGIYKAGPLIFNCKDDQLLLSLPIERKTVLFIRVFKFYVFELLFNSLYLLPIMIAYVRWSQNIDWAYFLICFVMLFILPIIPIVLSCFAGVFTSGLSSKFKYKNAVQIIMSMIFLIIILYCSFNMDGLFTYVINHATSMNDLIAKIYYPAFVFTKLVTNFNMFDLITFVLINVGIFILSIFILNKFYFKVNSRLKSVIVCNNKKINVDNLIIKSKSQTSSLVRKELNTFFKIPVFIINAGFALVLFVFIAIVISIRFDNIIPLLISEQNGLGLSKDLIISNMSVFIFVLISLAAFMTSITSSVISLEGKNIAILKALPIKEKTILISKILAALTITTPVLLIGNIILFIRFKINIIEAILLILLSVIMPLVSHFIGIIINLKYPKFDFESSAEVVKQSTSSFISVMVGMLLFIISVVVTINIVGHIKAVLLLFLAALVYLALDVILYIYLINVGTKKFNNLCD